MSLDDYILSHIDDEGDYLRALYRDTHLKLLYPRMASGHLQGRLLKMFVRMIRPAQVLEIGTYSGYSALCMAEGLPEGGMIHTFEINDEQEDFTRPWLERSAYAGKIKFYIGDALEQVPRLGLWPMSTATSAAMWTITRWCCSTLPPAVISLPTIPCGTAMCWKNIPATRKPWAYRPSTTGWRRTTVWRRSSSPCATG